MPIAPPGGFHAHATTTGFMAAISSGTCTTGLATCPITSRDPRDPCDPRAALRHSRSVAACAPDSNLPPPRANDTATPPTSIITPPSQTPPGNGWTGWQAVSGGGTTDAALAAIADGRIYLFAKGIIDRGINLNILE